MIHSYDKSLLGKLEYHEIGVYEGSVINISGKNHIVTKAPFYHLGILCIQLDNKEVCTPLSDLIPLPANNPNEVIITSQQNKHMQ